jgi:hypothetical protein
MRFISNHRRQLTGLAGLLIADGIVFGGTDARKVNAAMLIIGFGLLMASVYCLIYGLLAFVRLYGISIRGKRRLAGSFTGLTACLVALQSVGELNPRDVLLLLPLVAIGYLYSFYGPGRAGQDA